MVQILMQRLIQPVSMVSFVIGANINNNFGVFVAKPTSIPVELRVALFLTIGNFENASADVTMNTQNNV